MPIFNVTIPILTYTMPFRLEVSEAGELIRWHSLFDDLPEATQRLTLGEDITKVKKCLSTLGDELLSFAIPLWCAVGFAPPCFEELTEWASGRELATPNYIDSPHPEHLLRDYSFEYLYLALATTRIFRLSKLPNDTDLDFYIDDDDDDDDDFDFDLDFNTYEIVHEDHPLFAGLNQLLIPLITDANDRVYACNLLLNHPTAEKEAFVLRQYTEILKLTELRRNMEIPEYVETPEGEDVFEEPEAPDYTLISDRRLQCTLDFLPSFEDKRLLTEIANKLNIRPDAEAPPSLPSQPAGLWQMLENEEGDLSSIIGALLDLEERVDLLIDHCENTGEWLWVLATNFGKFQQRIKEDDRIPVPLEYILEVLVEYESAGMGLFINFDVGDFMKDYASKVDFKTLVNDYLTSGNPRLLVQGSLLLVKLWEYHTPIRSRKATGELETHFPEYKHPDRLFVVTENSLKALLHAVTNLSVDVGLDRGETWPFDALRLIAYLQPEAHSLIIDYLLQYACYTEEARSCELAELLADLFALGYRGNAIVGKIAELLNTIESIGTFLVESIASTHNEKLINLLELRAPAGASLRDDYTLRTAIDARLEAFTDAYHRLPVQNPYLTKSGQVKMD